MELQEITDRMNQFVETKGWYDPDSPKVQNERNLAISLSIEAAEILELYQWQESGVDRIELGGELADVLLYLLQLASVAGIDIEAAVLTKLEANQHRSW